MSELPQRLNTALAGRYSIEGKLSRLVEGEGVCEVELQEMPEYYLRDLQNGRTISEIAPTSQPSVGRSPN